MIISDTLENFFYSTEEIIIDVTPDYSRGPSVFALVCSDTSNVIPNFIR
jgi:hypothetical protein